MYITELINVTCICYASFIISIPTNIKNVKVIFWLRFGEPILIKLCIENLYIDLGDFLWVWVVFL